MATRIESERLNPIDPNESAVRAPSELAIRRLKLLIAHIGGLVPGGERGVIHAAVNASTVQRLMCNYEERWPPLMTYEQTADLVQVSVSTLKGWFSQGRFAKSVKRGKPARVIRDLFVVEFLRDEFGVNAE